MTSSTEILVLIANDRHATLCANTDGATRLLRSIECVLPVGSLCQDGEGMLRVRHNFACELMMALCRSTGDHMYDGVVIFAEGPMMDELRRVQTKAISQLMLAEVVGIPSGAGPFPGCNAANAQLAYLGAVH